MTTARFTVDKRVPALDGFRAIAIWMVMAYHLFGHSMGGRQWSFGPRVVAAVTSPGWLGVDVFFVLSGLLITTILLRTREDRNYFTRFYSRRARRILPLYLLVLTLTALLFDGSKQFYLACLLFGANFISLLGISGPESAIVFWSLAVEEHFYFVWPLAVRRLSRKGLAWVAAALVIGEPVLRFLCAARGIDTYWYSWFRLDGLALGALLALYLTSDLRSALLSRRLIGAGGLVFLSGCCFLAANGALTGAGGVPSGTLRFTIAECGFATAMLAALEFPGRWTAPLYSTAARVTANLSYCLYLIHYGIAKIYDRAFTHESFEGVTARAVAVTLVSYGLAWVSFKYLEKPLMAYRSAIHTQP